MPIIILFCLIILAILIWFAYKQVKSIRRNKIFSQPFPNHWMVIINENVPLYRRVPEKLKFHVHGCINLFIHEKIFVGRAIDIDDTIRLTIASNACMLLLHRQQKYFPNFKTIIVYPDTYVATQTNHDGNIHTPHASHRAGESWVRGPIVLSWGDTIRGSLNNKDGHNVVLHEFAHKLDELSGDMNGLPLLRSNNHYTEWAKVLNDEFNSLKHRANRGKNSVLDEYGTISAPEFFADATESFFEKSKQMKLKLPDLYKQLSRFYNIDPASW